MVNDPIGSIKAINESILKVLNDINLLSPFVPEETLPVYRLQENTYCLTDTQQKRLCGVITSHNIEQYGNRFYGISFKEDIMVWLDFLLDIDYQPIDYITEGEF